MNSSTETIGAFEAKTKLGELLERVSHGGCFTITKHDRPVARLIGYQHDLAAQRAEATTALRTQRQRYTLGGLGARSLREEGRP
jgi:prevent-host-death family protein